MPPNVAHRLIQSLICKLFYVPAQGYRAARYSRPNNGYKALTFLPMRVEVILTGVSFTTRRVGQ